MTDTSSRWRLDGARAVVTGGTKGIGLAVVHELIALGARVTAVARGEAAGDATLESAASRGLFHVVHADVSSASGRDAVIGGLPAGWDQVEILVNNVGTNIRKPSLDFSEDEYLRDLAGALFLPADALSGLTVDVEVEELRETFDKVRKGPPPPPPSKKKDSSVDVDMD